MFSRHDRYFGVDVKVGYTLGTSVRRTEGFQVGFKYGDFKGCNVGSIVGDFDGNRDGCSVGSIGGDNDTSLAEGFAEDFREGLESSLNIGMHGVKEGCR